MMADTSTGGRTLLDYALAYAERGFAVVPLHYILADGTCSCGKPHDGKEGRPSANGIGKHPHTLYARHGALSATRDPEVIRRWWGVEPSMNIGLAMGEASGVIAVDIDPRDGGDETWAQFVERQGAKVPDTLVQQTGGGGQHILFAYAADVTVRTPGKGVQIKGNGGYIVAEPSTHHTGGRYFWDSECDPLDGVAAAPVPAWLAAPKAAPVLSMQGTALVGYLPPDRVAEIRAALQHIDADDYQSWISVGMALHSTDAPEAFGLWDEYAQRSAKYDPAAQRAKWTSFGKRAQQLNVESIFVWARDQGWRGDYERAAVPVEQVRIAPPAAPRAEADTPAGLGLLQVPGILGRVVDWANNTAPKPQPLFAVGAALALGSVVCGRRFLAMPWRNWPSLYFVHVGKSGSGKEYARKVISACLERAERPELIGPNGYSSDAAVLSALMAQPVHLAVIDEIGALLRNLQSEGAMHGRSAVNALVEAWGAVDSQMRPKAYSTQGLREDQGAQQLSRVVYNPAISLLGMTTPGTFYSALQESSIEGGFLSRLIVLETDIGRQAMGEFGGQEVPPIVADWIGRATTGPAGNLSTVATPSGMRPAPVHVALTSRARELFRAFEADTLALQDELESEGLDVIEGRSLEKALRVATILAVSDRVDAPQINPDHAAWAIEFIRWASAGTVRAVRENMHGSKFAAWQAEVLRVIHRGGERGRTERDLTKLCRTYDGLDLRQRRQVLDALQAKGAIALVELKPPSGRGQKRAAWVAVDSTEED